MTVAATASALTQEGYKVLLIDLDAQRNLDMVAGHTENPSLEIPRNDTTTPNILHVLNGELKIEDILVPSAIGDLARASNSLYGWLGNRCLLERSFVDVCSELSEAIAIYSKQQLSPEQMLKQVYQRLDEMSNIITKENKFTLNQLANSANADSLILRKAIETIKNEYDYILIDTNPSLTLLTLNALCACDYVVIPTFPESSGVEAILELVETIDLVNANYNFDVKIAGVLMTKYSPNRKKSKRHDVILKEVVIDMLNSYLFTAKIRETEKASTYVEANADVIRNDPTGNTALDYIDFVKELKLRLSNCQ